MTTFSFSSGNPANLTGGATANMSDISGSLTDVRTFLNGANLDATNIAPVADTLLASPTNAVWRTVLPMQFVLNANNRALDNTSAFWYSHLSSTIVASGSSTASGSEALWVAPLAADEAVAGKTTRFRLRVVWANNPTAPGITITWGLYPVTPGGAVGLLGFTMGTVIAGSTAVATTPSGSSVGESKSAGFDMSAVTAGSSYLLGVAGSGTQAASSVIGGTAYLEMRHT